MWLTGCQYFTLLNKVEGEGGSILTGISTCLSIHPSVCQCVHLQGHLKLIECLSVLCCVFCTTDNMFETKTRHMDVLLSILLNGDGDSSVGRVSD